MKTVTETAYLIASPASWDESGYSYSIYTFKPQDKIIVSEMEISMDIPEGFDPNQPHIDMLQKEKQRIAGEAQIKMNNLEEQIQSLLAIECDS